MKLALRDRLGSARFSRCTSFYIDFSISSMSRLINNSNHPQPSLNQSHRVLWNSGHTLKMNPIFNHIMEKWVGIEPRDGNLFIISNKENKIFLQHVPHPRGSEQIYGHFCRTEPFYQKFQPWAHFLIQILFHTKYRSIGSFSNICLVWKIIY